MSLSNGTKLTLYGHEYGESIRFPYQEVVCESCDCMSGGSNYEWDPDDHPSWEEIKGILDGSDLAESASTEPLSDEDVIRKRVDDGYRVVDPPKWGQPYVCPVCNGRGFVPEGFYSTVNEEWSTAKMSTETCKTCMGYGIVWSPLS